MAPFGEKCRIEVVLWAGNGGTASLRRGPDMMKMIARTGIGSVGWVVMSWLWLSSSM